MKVACVGMSHLGIVTSLAFASRNYDVVALDNDERIIQSLNEMKFPIYEPNINELARTLNKLPQYSTDFSLLEKCKIVYITKDVPTNKSNESELEELESLVRLVSNHISIDSVLVLNSQVPPGFCRRLQDQLHRELIYQVETLVFGEAVNRALHPERIVIGCKEDSSSIDNDFENFLMKSNCPILKMNYESAELTKLAINLTLAAQVTTTNALAEICEEMGADWLQIKEALHLDSRIGPNAYLRPGLGLSGGNIERDISNIISIASKNKTEYSIFESFFTNSNHRRNWIVKILKENLNLSTRTKVTIWGATYKKATNSVKNSPSLYALRELSKYCNVSIFDPFINLFELELNGAQIASDPFLSLVDSVALIILSEDDFFQKREIRNYLTGQSDLLVIDPLGVYRDLFEKRTLYFVLGKGSH